MCCFSASVQSVSDTSIFARFGPRRRQYLVYSMKLQAAAELAMILPIPTPRDAGEDAVEFIGLDKYPEFFKDMAKGFPAPAKQGLGKGKFGAGGGFGGEPLAVVDVGNFEASFVPKVADFSRLDERFRLPAGAWDKLPQYKAYGFAVFKLKEGNREIHPMAFQFPSAARKLFFPTVHIHDGEIHRTADFDHTLYCQMTAGDASPLHRFQESPQPAGMFLDKEKSAGLIEPDSHCYRSVIQGRRRNTDVWV